MKKTKQMIRRSIYTFLQNYQYFTTTSILLALPFSTSTLLSQTIFAAFSPFGLITHDHLTSISQSIFGLYPPSKFMVSIFNLIFCQTIPTSILSLPFTLSFLLLSKASIIQILKLNNKPSFIPQPLFSSFSSLYKPLLLTNLCSIVLLVAINTTAFFSLLVFLKTLQAFGFAYYGHSLFCYVARAFLYFIFANSIVCCNLALVVAGLEKKSGFRAIHKACLLRRGRDSMAFVMVLCTSMALIAVEALFNYRVSKTYHIIGKLDTSMIVEGMFIAYLHSLLIVIDTISCCIFVKNFESDLRINRSNSFYCAINIVEDEEKRGE